MRLLRHAIPQGASMRLRFPYFHSLFLALLFGLLLVPLAGADVVNNPNPAAESSTLESLLAEIKSNGEHWALTGTAAGSFGIFGGNPNCNDPWQTTFAVGQLRNVLLLVFIVAIALTLLYMLGQFFQAPNLIATVKEEFFQISLMCAQVFALFFLFQGANMWYAIQVNPNAFPADPVAAGIYNPAVNPSIIDVAMAYSRLMIYKMTTELSSLAIFNSVLHTLYSSTLWFGVTWRAMWSFNLGPELKPLIDILSSSMQFLGIALNEWIVHLVTLCLIKKWTWGIYVPLAMMLYMVPHTRSAGAALLAIAFSLSLIYPLMFLSSYEVYRMTSGGLIGGDVAVRSFFQDSGILKFSLVAIAAAFMTAGVLMPLLAEAGIQVVFDLVRNSVYYVVIISILLPFLNIFITLTAAREFARAFGANVNFLAFLQLI